MAGRSGFHRCATSAGSDRHYDRWNHDDRRQPGAASFGHARRALDVARDGTRAHQRAKHGPDGICHERPANPRQLAAVVEQRQKVETTVKEERQRTEERKKDDEPKADHIRHILVKLPYGASDDEKAVALAKLSWAAARIKAGESFAEVARDTSDDTGSAAKGGDVGDKTGGFGTLAQDPETLHGRGGGQQSPS